MLFKLLPLAKVFLYSFCAETDETHTALQKEKETQHYVLLHNTEVNVIINGDTSDFAQADTVMRNDKAVNCLTGTVKMTKSKLSE